MISSVDIPGRWRSFFESDALVTRISHLAIQWPEHRHLKVTHGELHNFHPEFAQALMASPARHIKTGKHVLHEFISERHAKSIQPFLRIFSLPPDRLRLVKEVRSQDVFSMVGVEAIVSRISAVRPMTYVGRFRCRSCGNLTLVDQDDENILITPMSCTGTTENEGCGLPRAKTEWVLETRTEELVDTQFIELQEMPENVDSGAQPERISALAEQDLAGVLKPGDRLIANGYLYTRQQGTSSRPSPVLEMRLSLQSIEMQNRVYGEIGISDEDVERIELVSSRPDVLEYVAHSIAPSIEGYPHIKRSLALQLFGGVARRHQDGRRMRGDIHILMLGDPGTGKSQLIDYMADLSPRGVKASGQSASKAGLTATAVKDELSGGRWTLEAGALVLADLGLAAIDELDKMNAEDRSAMHEALEQQRIHVNKAGIHAQLNCRAPVVAAANPKDSKFNLSEVLTTQTQLEASLISRFDIIWTMLDRPDKEHDLEIVGRILKNRRKGRAEKVSHGHRSLNALIETGVTMIIDEEEEVLTPYFIRKYVAHARLTCHPVLDDEAADLIRDFYIDTRDPRERENTTDGYSRIAITPRGAEAAIRMTEASARLHLREVATVEDAKTAIMIMEHWRSEMMGKDFDEVELSTGKNVSQRKNQDVILDVIKRMSDGRNGVHEATIIGECTREGMSERSVKNALHKLSEAGVLYNPRHGIYELG